MDIRFPHLGIDITHLGKSIEIFGFSIAYYGMIIALGMVLGYFMACFQAKRTGQNPEIYMDLAICDIISAILGARIYYVIFSWKDYKDHPLEVFNIRGGGLAIYGGVIAGVLATFIFAKVKQLSFLQLVDTAVAGLLVGQILGRWGNFFNREAFGGYTDGLFAMQIPRDDVSISYVAGETTKHLVSFGGREYIQVHPTFLYESLWNLAVLIIILFITKKVRSHGQLFFTYLLGYGLGRVWIEGLRTDQLLISGTTLPVSQVLSAVLVVFAGIMLVYTTICSKKTKKQEK